MTFGRLTQEDVFVADNVGSSTISAFIPGAADTIFQIISSNSYGLTAFSYRPAFCVVSINLFIRLVRYLKAGNPSQGARRQEGKRMKHQHGPRVGTHAATIWFFLTFFLLPRFGYGEVGNPQSHRADPIVPGQFIVVLNRSFDPAQVASDHAAVPFHLYRVAPRGFAARLSTPKPTRFEATRVSTM